MDLFLIGNPTDEDRRNVLQIAFSMVHNLTNEGAAELLRRVGSVENFFTLTASQLGALTNLGPKWIADDYRRDLIREAEREYLFCKEHSIDFIPSADKSRYPRRLDLCSDAPALIYRLGADCLDAERVVAVVGTRHATAYGTSFTERLVADLAASLPGTVIVSGMAYGIDVAAHRAAIESGLPTVAVMAHGLNMVYPSEHRSVATAALEGGGAIVTEYNSQSRMYKYNFLARNRIIAGLADVTVVVESDVKGGAMATARIANAYSREVMAVPGRTNDTYSRGCNHLIAMQCASLLRDASDLVNLMGWEKQAVPCQKTLFPELSEFQRKVVKYLKENPEATVNEMCVALSMPYQRLSAELFQMTVDDILANLPGGRYVVVGDVGDL